MSLFYGRRGGFLWILVLFLVVVLLVVVLVVVNIVAKEPEPVDGNVTLNKTYYHNILLRTNSLGSVRYRLTNGSSTLVEGWIPSGSVETYMGNIEANQSVFFYAWSRDYYYGMRNCTISFEGYYCQLNLSKKASEYLLLLDENNLVVDTQGLGLVQRPVFCWRESRSVRNVLMSLPSASKPSGWEKLVDFCYQADDVSGRKVFPITVRKNGFYEGEPLDLSVFVFDYEKVGYDPIGVRNTSIMI